MSIIRSQINAQVLRAKGTVDQVVRKIVLDIGTRLVERSPVGNPELWAINDMTLLKRETYATFMEESRGVRPSNKALKSRYKTKAPKGYVGGRFRGNWQHGSYGGLSAAGGVSMTGVPQGELPDIDPSGARAVARLANSVNSSPGGGVIHAFRNNLPYAERLENGWSRQAPAGIVGLTVVEFEGVVRAVAATVKT